MVTATADAVASALGAMRTMLRADGYDLHVQVEDGTIGLTVRATPEACAECLVPKELFASMAVGMLGDGGIAAGLADVRVRYPLDP